VTVTTTIENNGMIEQLRLPEAFSPAMLAGEQHHGYLEFEGPVEVDHFRLTSPSC